jgi:signal transduction histidine kinase
MTLSTLIPQISFNFSVPAQSPQSVTLWFTQTAIGQVESFFSVPGALFSEYVEQIVGQRVTTALFRPEDPERYCRVIDRVITSGRAESMDWPFLWNGMSVNVTLTMSPIPQPDGTVNTVLVQGTCEVQPLLSISSGLDVANRYHRLLTQISWSIRRTLDLKTIWQQTVDGLGATLSIDRCSIYSLDENAGQVKIEAEFCGMGQESWRGRAELLEPQLSFRQAIALLRPSPLIDEPLVLSELVDPTVESLSGGDYCVVTDQVEEAGLTYQRMIVATGYQDEVNGLIVLWRSPMRSGWNEPELNFLEELADQVGTAIAHAELFNKLESANYSLIRQREALEEAIERAEEASRLKSEFLANTSHELRTPLNGMIGFLKLILDGMADDPEEQQEFLEESLKSAEHLLDLLTDILDLAKIEAGKLEIELSPVALGEVFEQLQRSQTNSAARKNLTFEIQMPQTRDEVMIYANYKRLYQVLLNLVGNAIKFTHEGGITIATEIVKRKVTIQNQECPGLMMVRVADTGIGVSLEKQDRLFQSFSQIDGSTTRRYGGTGLGLAISQTLVSKMGGEVNFYSMGEGLGSTVTFTIPLFQEPIA